MSIAFLPSIPLHKYNSRLSSITVAGSFCPLRLRDPKRPLSFRRFVSSPGPVLVAEGKSSEELRRGSAEGGTGSAEGGTYSNVNLPELLKKDALEFYKQAKEKGDEKQIIFWYEKLENGSATKDQSTSDLEKKPEKVTLAHVTFRAFLNVLSFLLKRPVQRV
mmetsp:Transcript_36007/g.59993  ORF Transcript_36007/g.59993 Transcript_36007/m.59993 type:complete len:162 (+) Transcript_36007:51-536(+)|eukprot:CAMPEP_0184675664 /NCGR_PEP_ID=MMETSP0308-20130426/87911_1 /TAXON_ID=38269 /ORGANISM="Gloeochaete witrockiana, Strain SAG 46.84" /LENGTH=161 /DNA_ID=CAMNT_0027123389 /DNA_START=46 /DNA_END=531 /DNA_ORIENTATION=+